MRLSRPLTCLLACLLLAALPGQAQRLLDWRGASAPAAARPPGAGGRDWLELESSGGVWLAWVANPWAGPAQVRLRGHGAGYRSVPALPAEATLKPGERRVLARLYPHPAHVPERIDLQVDAVPGAPGARADATLYRLPFAAPVRIDQGFGGAFSHRDAANRYALDFALPEGTPVLAARGGTVMQVLADFHDAGLDRERFGARANTIRVLHDDGSMALYAHLSADGIAVRPGQRVRAGQRLALSGNTGLSTAPHLHFAVQLNRGLRLESVPFRMTGPLGELRFPQPAD